ncbi:TPA: hypothetical protein I9Y78_002768 [Elizabethkingia anophelis]|uniref:hypothetical protein n=1 Tax=Elizabethkingia anophelis TaxID=1117645 RepID=UPI0004279AA6|nr:hypothetical protein [Elizabethkingia anophelis]MCT3744029.1 hypothetical protein [Elizabethkingia anophelis]MDC8026622.1 hypothetical protein [Elizabethkingia anophelis]MDV3491828.1 hypothetical protein [Elizabethkingia anophelis]MDV4132056.1 hypothetical protein [Elizabethkingia anophelis]MDV4135461.1 hypothetical protein [Elizabethkingia anophelis]
MRIDSGSVNYFLRAYFQYVLIPLVIIGIISYIVPEEEHYPPLFYIIITAFILVLFLIISFHEYFSIKKKSKISTLFIRQGELYINNKKKLPLAEITSITPLYYNPLIGKIMIHFFEIKTGNEIFYFFDKPRFMWNIMTPLSVKKLEKIFPELQPVIQEQATIRKLPNT